MYASLSEIKKRSVGEVVGGLKAATPNASLDAADVLLADARKFGLTIRDYLTLAIKSEKDFSGYELALAELNLPIRNDFANGVVLQAASDTFQTFPGTRAMFPPVIDDILRWAVRQDQFEQIAKLVGNSRPMSGNELISTVVNDDSAARDSFVVPELANIPVQSIRTSEVSVKMYKHGSALRTSYEFSRRASLDVLTPYAARIARQLEISKVAHATALLINGDGVNGAAPVVTQSSLNAATGGAAAVNGVLSWRHMLRWLVNQAKAGVPVDTVVGNWDSAFAWAMLYQVPVANAAGVSDAQNLQVVKQYVAPGSGLNIPLPNFAVSSSAPANKLIGYSKADTLEELVENGSQISESERVLRNQAIIYTKTENTGYRLPYGDTRSIFDYGN
jgi:hypothetical protein